VTNLVSPAMHSNFGPMAAYFPSRHSPMTQPIIGHPPLSSSGNSNCFDPSDVNQANGTRIPYFNSPAAAAFMSAASVPVGALHQANSTTKSHNSAGPTVSSAISIFNPFGTDVSKFSDKTSNAGKWVPIY